VVSGPQPFEPGSIASSAAGLDLGADPDDYERVFMNKRS
jgi:hypothetical protein